MPSWEQIHNEIKVLALLCRFESDSKAANGQSERMAAFGTAHFLLVAGFLLCQLRQHERFVSDAELPLRRPDFVTLRAERPHFFILWACEITAPPAPFYIASRDGSMLAEVA